MSEELSTISLAVSVYRETGKWLASFEVTVPYNNATRWDAAALLTEIDKAQTEITKGAILNHGYFVVVDDSPQLKLTPEASFFINRLYSPAMINEAMSKPAKESVNG